MSDVIIRKCPNCKFDYLEHFRVGGDIRHDFLLTVSKCRKCGHFMCDRCCAHLSFWRGHKCPQCGSYATTTVGHITHRGYGGSSL